MDNKNEKTFADLFSSATFSDDIDKNTDLSILDKVEEDIVNNDNINNTFSINGVSNELNNNDEEVNSNDVVLGNLFTDNTNDESTNSVYDENSVDSLDNEVKLENNTSISKKNNDKLVENVDDSNLFFS